MGNKVTKPKKEKVSGEKLLDVAKIIQDNAHNQLRSSFHRKRTQGETNMTSSKSLAEAAKLEKKRRNGKEFKR